MLAPLLLLLGTSAHATEPDQFGFGARSMGAGGGGVAMVETGAAAGLNPAGLSRIRRPTAAIGFFGSVDRFRDMPDLWWDTNRDGVIDAEDPPLEWSGDIENINGLQIQVGKQVGGKFGLGLMMWLPAKRLYRLANTDPALPHYAFYNNRPQRYVLAAGFGGEIVKGVNIGVSADMHSKAKFDLYGTLDATVTSPDDPDTGIDELVTEIRVDVHDLELDLGYAIRPVFGVQLELGRWSEPLDGLVVGATYRPAIPVQVDADLDIQANVALEDIGDLDPFMLGSIVQARAILYDLYVPTRVGLGVAWRSDDVFSAYADATFEGWKGAEFAVTKLDSAAITAPLISIDDAVVDGNEYEAVFRDTLTFKGGMELKLHPWELDNDLRYVRLVFRGGFAFAPSPLVAQGEASAFLDSDRVSVTIGAGSETWDPFELVDGPVRFDVYAQVHQLGRTTLPHQTDVPRAGFPREGDGIPIGGSIVVVGGQWGFDY